MISCRTPSRIISAMPRQAGAMPSLSSARLAPLRSKSRCENRPGPGSRRTCRNAIGAPAPVPESEEIGVSDTEAITRRLDSTSSPRSRRSRSSRCSYGPQMGPPVHEVRTPGTSSRPRWVPRRDRGGAARIALVDHRPPDPSYAAQITRRMASGAQDHGGREGVTAGRCGAMEDRTAQGCR